MSARKDGGAAFPQYVPDGLGGLNIQGGMTLRDWFAGQALAGDLASQEASEAIYEQASENALLMARRAYRYADAMLSARATPRAGGEG